MPAGVELYVVPTATSNRLENYPPSQWLQKAGLGSVPTLVDSKHDTALKAFGDGAFPYLVLLDKDNRVVVRSSGELPDGTYPGLFAALAKGQPITFNPNGASSPST
jgi:hypothetical protein